MASTYSTDLRLELIGSGEQSGVWGSTTNLNLGELVEQAIAGVEAIVVPSSSYALETFYGAVDEARNAVLVLSSGAAANVYVPPVDKVYVVKNTGSFAITMYNSTVVGNTTAAGTGITVAAGTAILLFTDGTNFYTAGLPTGSSTGTGNVVFSASPTLTGTPLAPTAAGGTNTTQIATTAFVNTSITTATTALGLGTMATQNASSVTITGGSITGITDLAVADGGTGSSTLAANNVLLGNGTSALQTVAPSTSGNVLASNGTTWGSSALSSLSVFDKSLSSNGYQKLPGGLIMQWCVGTASSSETTQTISWPISFPNAVLNVQASTYEGSTGADRMIQIRSFSTSSVVVYFNSIGGAGGDIIPYVFAIGY
jgi:hypothetical protein